MGVGASSLDQNAEITQLLARSNQGEKEAREKVVELVYQELHKIAKRQGLRTGETLRPTVLINEAYMKLFGGQTTYENRQKLFACATLAMRQIILNYAEKTRAKKRGGHRIQLTLRESDTASSIETNFEALDEALDMLEKVHPRYAQIVSLNYFAGFKKREIAEILEVSERTVYDDLRLAKAWLLRKLNHLSPPT